MIPRSGSGWLRVPLARRLSAYCPRIREKTQCRLNLLGTSVRANSPLPWGRDDKGAIVEQVVLLMQDERVRLDQDRLGELYAQLGEPGAEDVVCRAMEELAARLAHAARMYQQEELADLRKSARSMAAIADQIGMQLLARVARDVTACIDAGDGNGLAATLARLLRIGEGSLTAVWDLRDLSV